MTTIAEAYGIKPPRPFGYKGVEVRSTNPELMMGIELEIEGLPRGADDYIDDLSSKGFVVTTDESLRGVNIRRTGQQTAGFAYEFISKPMAQAHLIHGLEQFFKVVPCTAANYTDRTSVHVHVNCLDMTHEQVQCLALLYTVVEDIMFKFVGNDRDQNIYCIPWRQCRLNHDMLEKMEMHGKTAIKQWQKYTALNLLPLINQGTVEFRHMNGTCDLPRLTQWLNMIGAMFGYAKRLQLTTLIDEIKALNSTSEYHAFFGQVFQDSLLYDEAYRESLESGVLVAKYGLINWKKKEKRDWQGRQYSAEATNAVLDDTGEDAPVRRHAFLQRYLDDVRNNPPQAQEAQPVLYGNLFANATAPQPAPRAVTRPVRPARPEPPTPLRNVLNPWPATGRSVFLGATGLDALNNAELTTLGQHAGQWNMNRELQRLEIIGQPAVAEAR